MNLRLLTFFALLLGSGLSLRAQNSDDPGVPRRTPEELRELLGPIALYPDPLISLILPAATVPSDVVLAARFVKAGGSPDDIEDRAWDSSVKALTRYPDTLTWMDENLEWTTQVGDAFASQPEDVMEAVQDLRAKARAMGNLVDSPQQRVVEDDTAIRIVPAQPEYIYEPRYDPQVVYFERPAAEPLLYFGAPLLVGSWLAFDFDWRRHRLYRGDWREGWDYRRDHERRERQEIYVNNRFTNVVPWHVDTKRRHEEVRRPSPDRVASSKAKPVIVRPTSIVEHMKNKGGEVRRAEPVGSGKFPPVAGTMKPGDKGKVNRPTTPAPFVSGDGKMHKGDGSKPHNDSPKPKGDTPKGFTEIVKPKGDSPKPKSDSPKPKFDSPKPKGDTPKPKFDAPKPKSDSPKPKGDSPKPKFDAPKPKMDAPKQKPKVDAPKPKMDAPKPKSPSPPQGQDHKSSSDSSKDGKKKDKKN